MNQDATHPAVFSRDPLETPNLFASYRIGDYPHAGLLHPPWEMTGTQAVLVNAFDLLANHRTRRFTSKIRDTKGGLREYIHFDGPLMLDSGGFNFQKQKEISIASLDVFDIGIEFAVDVSVVLDHPFLPTSTPEEMEDRWKSTVTNTEEMFEKLEDSNPPDYFQLMPVLHGYDPETLKRSLDHIIEIWGEEPRIVGIGSLAPLALNGSKRTVINVISTVRQLLPNAHIHCFSLGSALLMLFAFYCGADTVDSQSWIISAAFKNVQLPGFPWTRFSSREKEKDPAKYQQKCNAFADRLLELIEEEEFAVKDWDNRKDWEVNNKEEALSYLDYLEHRDGERHIHRRACHNLYAFNFEAKRVREEKKKGVSALETFIQGRMKSPVYQKIFEYAIEKVNSKS
ncbi:MAG: hypothetical protein OXU51_01530 [Candidatus Poribacteria bacterium]|nr:hypothetical protein [Candidatus Poribacteria bacterium]